MCPVLNIKSSYWRSWFKLNILAPLERIYAFFAIKQRVTFNMKGMGYSCSETPMLALQYEPWCGRPSFAFVRGFAAVNWRQGVHQSRIHSMWRKHQSDCLDQNYLLSKWLKLNMAWFQWNHSIYNIYRADGARHRNLGPNFKFVFWGLSPKR